MLHHIVHNSNDYQGLLTTSCHKLLKQHCPSALRVHRTCKAKVPTTALPCTSCQVFLIVITSLVYHAYPVMHSL